MLSLIVLSNRNGLFDRLVQNVAETAGCPYEIIREGEVSKGLCFAYNRAAAKATFEHLCFVHDDVLFHTPGWGPGIATQLRNAQTGVVGIMGSRYKSFFGAGWRDGSTGFFRMNVKDGVENGRLLVQNPANKKADEVICLDGAFLCCTKAHWQAYPFDGKTFRGFHFYDLDFCLQMHTAGLKNLVTYDVLLEHFSQGKKDAAFLNDFRLFQKKWAAVLPLHLDALPPSGIKNFEGYALAETLWLMKKVRSGKKERRRQLIAYWQRYKSPYHLLRSFYFGFLK